MEYPNYLTVLDIISITLSNLILKSQEHRQNGMRIMMSNIMTTVWVWPQKPQHRQQGQQAQQNNKVTEIGAVLICRLSWTWTGTSGLLVLLRCQALGFETIKDADLPDSGCIRWEWGWLSPAASWVSQSHTLRNQLLGPPDKTAPSPTLQLGNLNLITDWRSCLPSSLQPSREASPGVDTHWGIPSKTMCYSRRKGKRLPFILVSPGRWHILVLWFYSGRPQALPSGLLGSRTERRQCSSAWVSWGSSLATMPLRLQLSRYLQ